MSVMISVIILSLSWDRTILPGLVHFFIIGPQTGSELRVGLHVPRSRFRISKSLIAFINLYSSGIRLNSSSHVALTMIMLDKLSKKLTTQSNLPAISRICFIDLGS